MSLRAVVLAVVLALGGIAGALAGGGSTAAAQGGDGTYTITACSPSTTNGRLDIG